MIEEAFRSRRMEERRAVFYSELLQLLTPVSG
jgi:hypothetical protein